MRYMVVALLVLISSTVRAQFDRPIQPKGGTLSIPSDPFIRSNTKLLGPKSDPGNYNYKSSKTVDELTSSERREREQVVDPKLLLMNEGKGNEFYKTFQRNQDLGDISTTSTSVRISCRDHEYVDGDMIRIYLNDQVLVPSLILKGSFSFFDIKLIEGLNTIDFEALNEGSSPPNTAELKIYDEQGALLCGREWNIAAGFRASVLVVKR